jgi:gliding motility-associated lipoprotein GldH
MNKGVCLYLVILFTLIFYSCDQDRIFEKNVEIPEFKWNKNEPIVFSIDISDTNTIHNVHINVRNSGNYSYSNLFLFITTFSPTGHWIKDTLEIPLADKRGKWLGSGIGDIYFNRKIFKNNVRFPVYGIYTFEIRQGMRTDYLSGIRDVGLRIEKAK